MRAIKNKLVSFGESLLNATGMFVQTFSCWQIGIATAYVMQVAASGGAMPGELLLFAFVASEIFAMGNALFEAGKSFWAKFSRNENYSGRFGQSNDRVEPSNNFNFHPPGITNSRCRSVEASSGVPHVLCEGCSCCSQGFS